MSCAGCAAHVEKALCYTSSVMQHARANIALHMALPAIAYVHVAAVKMYLHAGNARRTAQIGTAMALSSASVESNGLRWGRPER